MFAVGDLFSRHARYRGDRLAFVFGDTAWNYAELNAHINQLANVLLKFGIKRHDHLAVVLPNCVDLYVLYWATAKLGVVIVPLSPQLNVEGMKALIIDADAVGIVVSEPIAEILTDHLNALKTLREHSAFVIGTHAVSGFHLLDKEIADAAVNEPPDQQVTPDDLMNIIYSSGTTGTPKGIMTSHFVRAMYGMHFSATFRYTPEAVTLHSGSIVFNGAFCTLMPTVYQGATYVLMETFNVEKFIELVKQYQVTHVIMVPSQIIEMLNSPRFNAENLSSLQCICSVGAPLLQEYKEKLFHQLPDRVYELYGYTEGFATILDKTDTATQGGTVGSCPPFTALKIVDDKGLELPAGEIGEIIGTSPIMSLGYYKQPEKTAETFSHGWAKSGDLGYVDEQGFLHLVDRKKDMIISGGINVYPKDIEEIIAHHDQVKEVAVFGISHAKWGEVPIAAIVKNSNDAFDIPSIKDWINQHVHAKYQRVHDVFLVESMPRNVAGKTVKRELLIQYQQTQQRLKSTSSSEL